LRPSPQYQPRDTLPEVAPAPDRDARALTPRADTDTALVASARLVGPLLKRRARRSTAQPPLKPRCRVESGDWRPALRAGTLWHAACAGHRHPSTRSRNPKCRTTLASRNPIAVPS